MLKKNDELIGIVTGIGSNGEGVIKIDGNVVFVPFTIMGEKVRFRVLKVTSKCVYAKVVEVLTPADERIRPKCPVFGKCGGCQLQHVNYTTQLKIKEETVKTCFAKIAGLNVSVKSIAKCKNEFAYRNKLQLPVSQTDNGPVIGFYAEGTHRVIPIDTCPINPSWTDKVITSVKQYMKEYNLTGYVESTMEGDIREVTVKDIRGNLIITIVTLRRDLPGKERLVEIFDNNLKAVFSLYLNVNSVQTNVIYGDEFYLLHGKPDYMGKMRGIKYKIGVCSFMQVNDEVCTKLYSSVRDAVEPDEDTVVIDAYSGAGLMTAMLASNANKAIGIEIVPEAVECANDLAVMNELQDKITNYQGKCEEILPDIIENEKRSGKKISLVLDPPRKGCDKKVIDAIINSDIDKIVYVSCMPSTLARDVGLICGTLEYVDGGIKKAEDAKLRYKVEYVRPFDMFPQTKHVETLVVLQRK